MKKHDKPTYSIAQNVAWMIQTAWQTRKRVLVFCILTAVLEILYNITQLFLGPEILKRVEQTAPLSELLMTIAVFTLALFALMTLKKYVDENQLYPRIEVRQKIISMVGRKTNSTSFSNTLHKRFLRLYNKCMSAVCSNSSASEQIWSTLTDLLQNIGGFLVYLTILSHLNVTLLVLVIVTCLVEFAVSSHTNNWIYAHREEDETYDTKISYLQQKAESIQLAKDIRIFGLQNWINDILISIYNLYLDFRLRCEAKLLVRDITDAVLTMARNGLAYVYLIHLCLTENLGVPEFLLYFTAFSTFTTWVMGILQAVSQLHKNSLDLSSLRDFLEYPEPFRFQEGEAVPTAKGYEIKLDHVSYRYPEAEEDTIHDLSLTIPAGEKLAVVGLNGAGKTTLIKLICGLLDPTEGTVLLNGQDVRTFNRDAYYELFSAVFQDFSIWDVTIAENIAQSATDIDRNRVQSCIEKAGLEKTIAELPNGVNTHVGREVYLDGVLFSGGQTQRLMLARALYKDGPILILDEPTAALDPIAENDIYQKYDEMTTNKTSLFISHRLASTRFCDRIIFLSDGQITEEGTHESLLAAGGGYAKLFEVQSRYYQEGRDF